MRVGRNRRIAAPQNVSAFFGPYVSMKLSLTACLIVPLVLAAASPVLDEGQGTARPGSRIEELRAGRPVLGAHFDPAQAQGKVVVVKIGGS